MTFWQLFFLILYPEFLFHNNNGEIPFFFAASYSLLLDFELYVSAGPCELLS